MTDLKRFRRTLSLFALVSVVSVGSYAAGCGSDDSSTFNAGSDGGGGEGGVLSDGNPGQFGGDGSGGSGDGSVSAIQITPANPTVDVNVMNGVVTTTPVNFVAKLLDGTQVAASWSLDRGELGALATATGVFDASGNIAGTGIVSAAYGATIATTNVTVHIHSIQVGNDYGDGGVPEAGGGGVGGVGGEGLGGPVSGGVESSLQTTNNPPATDSVLGWLYPYDKTVWPRGLLAPLLQWQSNVAGINAVYIHLTENNFEFEGFYSVAGPSQFHQPIDQGAWAQATNSNSGDNLHVEVKINGTAGVVGPITRDWLVAPGVLTGTIYYQTYNNNNAGIAGGAGTLAIRPGKTDPQLAIPGTYGACVVCHEVSGDGSTLFAEVNRISGGNNDYSEGRAYDLTDGGATIQTYSANAPDGTTYNRKFLWSGVSKDGTFAMASLNRTREAFGGPENVYRRDNGNAISTPGLQIVTEGVTPEFSRDEKSMAFDAWTLQSDAGLASGNGHTLDVMDMNCNPGDAGAGGGTAAGAPPSCASIDFSNLRRLYTNGDATNGWVGWPAWTPDSNGVIFHNAVRKADEVSSNLATWHHAEAQLWYVNVPPASGVYADGGAAPAANPILMNAINGLNTSGVSYLPPPSAVTGANANHSDDVKYNYEPTMNPIPSGGYFWVVFTSRRMYGNIAATDPYS
ncbi:MAG: hypothetical protein ACRELY_16945, partial [Polyangiaceae bacterium]